MRKLVLVGLMACLFGITAQASGIKPRKMCVYVNSYKSANYHFKKFAYKTIDQGEVSNSVAVVGRKKGLYAINKLMKESGASWAQMRKLKAAKWFAVVMQHFDEDVISYYTISQGKFAPKKVLEINIVDIEESFPKTLKKDYLLFSLGLKNLKDWHYEELKDMKGDKGRR